VDDHAFLVEGLKARLELERDITFVGRLPSALGLADAAEKLHADVVLLDIEMPGPDPFASLADLVRARPKTKTIILSAHIRDHYIDEAVEAGAWGYFSKGDSPDALVDAIRKVTTGEFVLGGEVRKRQQLGRDGASRGQVGVKSRLSMLTPREREVLRLIGEGKSRSQIAQTLHRSPKTIDAHREAIMRKLDIHDRGELVRFAIREGVAEV